MTRIRLRILLLISAIALGSCFPFRRVDPIYLRCLDAQRAGRLENAEMECIRVVEIVREDRMGPGYESIGLHDLGRIQRTLGKLGSAEQSFRASLKIEEELSGYRSDRTGRRIAELAAVLYRMDRAEDGLEYAVRLLTVGPHMTVDRDKAARVLYAYSDHLYRVGQAERAKNMSEHARNLGFPGDFYAPGVAFVDLAGSFPPVTRTAP